MVWALGRAGYSVGFSEEYGSDIGGNRDKNVDAARTVEAKWLFTLDDDMMMPEDTILRLMKRDKSIVSGLYFGRQPPCWPIAYNRIGDEFHNITSWNEQGLTEVDSVGAGCCLIKMKVFDSIKRPYYTFNEWGEGRISEDTYFCNKAKAVGIPIYIDASISIGHIGDYPFTVEDYWKYEKYRTGGKKDDR